MQSHKNSVIIAAAGGGKTAFIVECALKEKNKNILITTYTVENTNIIKSYIIKANGCIPKNITILPWFTFLLREGVRPYQSYIIPTGRVASIDFKVDSPPIVIGGRDNAAYFVDKANYLYKDRISEFVYFCNERSQGLVIKRLEKIFDYIFIDEMQDMAGWDQNFIELLLNSSIVINLVGDPRQATYSTNNSRKNKATKGASMVAWIEKLEKKNLCNIETRTDCYRCNSHICSFADNLYPDLPQSVSKNSVVTEHDGIISLKRGEILEYVEKYKPVILRWDKRSQTMGLPAINFGNSKGSTYERVLIFPTKPMLDYLKTKKLEKLKDISKAKLYVAITRAKHSVAFAIDE